jgi:preprotein translocase subunit SecE
VNRQTKRMMKRQGGGDGQTPPERRRPSAPPPHKERTTVRQFGRDVRSELRKVAWPTRPEVVNSTLIVLVAVVVMTALIFGFDFAFAKGVPKLYD